MEKLWTRTSDMARAPSILSAHARLVSTYRARPTESGKGRERPPSLQRDFRTGHIAFGASLVHRATDCRRDVSRHQRAASRGDLTLDSRGTTMVVLRRILVAVVAITLLATGQTAVVPSAWAGTE